MAQIFFRKLKMTFSCPTKFQRFPLDTQICPMMFESFGATMDSLCFNWLDSPVDVDPVVQLSNNCHQFQWIPNVA